VIGLVIDGCSMAAFNATVACAPLGAAATSCWRSCREAEAVRDGTESRSTLKRALFAGPTEGNIFQATASLDRDSGLLAAVVSCACRWNTALTRLAFDDDMCAWECRDTGMLDLRRPRTREIKQQESAAISWTDSTVKPGLGLPSYIQRLLQEALQTPQEGRQSGVAGNGEGGVADVCNVTNDPAVKPGLGLPSYNQRLLQEALQTPREGRWSGVAGNGEGSATGPQPAIPACSRNWRLPASWPQGHTPPICSPHRQASACCCWSVRLPDPRCSPPSHAPCGAVKLPSACLGSRGKPLPPAPCRKNRWLKDKSGGAKKIITCSQLLKLGKVVQRNRSAPVSIILVC